MNRKHVIGAAVVALIVAGSCSGEAMPPPAHLGCGPSNPAAEDAIREPVLRTLFSLAMFQNQAESRSIESYFVGVHEPDKLGSPMFEWDPSDDLLGRLRAAEPRVQPVSQHRLAEHSIYGTILVDQVSGHRGVIFTVGHLCWQGLDHVDVEAHRRLDAGNVYDFQFHVSLRAGKWVVDSWEITGVS